MDVYIHLSFKNKKVYYAYVVQLDFTLFHRYLSTCIQKFTSLLNCNSVYVRHNLLNHHSMMFV